MHTLLHGCNCAMHSRINAACLLARQHTRLQPSGVHTRCTISGCRRTLFATHYHGLNHEPELQPIVQRAHMATAVQEGTFVPLFQLREGPAPEVG